MGIVQSSDAPGAGNNGEKAHIGYRMVVEPLGQRVRAVFNGETIVDSIRAMVMRETRLPPAFYFAREDVRMDFLSRTDRHTNCPFKGNAFYWTVTVGEQSAENAAWSYEDVYDEAAIVKNYIALYWNEMDSWLVDDDEMEQIVIRIKARAYRRLGELLAVCQADKAEVLRLNTSDGDATDPIGSQRQAAASAGLSIRQEKTASRIAKIPESEFEEAVEAPKPVTATQLADMGKRTAPIARPVCLIPHSQ